MKRNLATLIFILTTCVAIAQSAVKPELYKSARSNFARGKYVDAIRDFSAFQGANEDYLNHHKDLKNAISSAITICEQRIEAKKTEDAPQQAQSNRFMSQINAAAIKDKPGPIYLLADDSLVAPLVQRDFMLHLDLLRNKPFSGIEFNCLTNISTDSLEQFNYVMDRITLFKGILEEQGIPSNQIIWTVVDIADDQNRLIYCLNGFNPERGALCLEVNYNHRLSKFELEP